MTAVVQQLLYQVHVGHEHAPAAVSSQVQRVQGFTAGREAWVEKHLSQQVCKHNPMSMTLTLPSTPPG
jgi:hypothetical protein